MVDLDFRGVELTGWINGKIQENIYLPGYEERAGQIGLTEADQRDRVIYRTTARMWEDIYGEDVRERAQSIAV